MKTFFISSLYLSIFSLLLFSCKKEDEDDLSIENSIIKYDELFRVKLNTTENAQFETNQIRHVTFSGKGRILLAAFSSVDIETRDIYASIDVTSGIKCKITEDPSIRTFMQAVGIAGFCPLSIPCWILLAK